MPQFDMDRLFDFLIVIVIIVGPVLAAITKKLIVFFSPKEPELPTPKPRSKPVAQPTVAKRWPSDRRPDETLERPRSHTARPASGRPGPSPAALRKPVARPIPPPPKPRPIGPQREPAPTGIPMVLEALVEGHLGHLTSDVEGETERIAQGVENRLRHVESSIAAVEEAAARPSEEIGSARIARKSGAYRQLPRLELRRGIVLREVLGPPVALREPGETL